MGQFALGIRSLLVKAAIFVIMAALLAWALGGTLWPKPARVDLSAVQMGGSAWFWRVTAENKRSANGNVTWQFMRAIGDEDPKPVNVTRWRDVAGPITTSDALYFAGRPVRDGDNSHSAASWIIVGVNAKGESVSQSPMPDRLAVEEQFVRVQAGLLLQDLETIMQQRARGLDPQGNSADE
jgi:hypothetical protein